MEAIMTKLKAKSSPKQRMEPEFEAINANWHPPTEAFFFWRLVFRGVLSPEQAKKDILMTETQLGWLIHQYPLDAPILREIYWLRKQTYKAFLFLCANPEAAQEIEKLASSKAAHARKGGRPAFNDRSHKAKAENERMARLSRLVKWNPA